MSGASPVMNMLNGVAWHTLQINRISDELNKLGVSDDEIESFLDDYEKFIQDAYRKDEKPKSRVYELFEFMERSL